MGKDKKVWSELEDELLKKLYQQDRMRNWSQIAKRMTEEYNTPKKSGKQCRQRYQNHIDTSIIKIQWTKQEEHQLIRLHNDIGNKWANIAHFLPGKSDNCVKNHFYSKLRKVLRKLNKIIHQHFRRQFRQININVIYKLVEATQQKFKQSPNCHQQVSIKCRDIQNKMLEITIVNEEQQSEQDQQSLGMYRQIVREIYSASRQYKRKSKKSRNLSIQAPNGKKSKQEKQRKQDKSNSHLAKSKAPSDGYMSDSSNSNNQESKYSDQSYKKNVLPPHTFIVNQEQKPTVLDKKIQIEEGKEGIQNLLRQNNILENQFSITNNINLFKFSSDKSSFRSYNNSDRDSDKDFFNMFQSSDGQIGTRRKSSNYLYFFQGGENNKDVSFSQKQ